MSSTKLEVEVVKFEPKIRKPAIEERAIVVKDAREFVRLVCTILGGVMIDENTCVVRRYLTPGSREPRPEFIVDSSVKPVRVYAREFTIAVPERISVDVVEVANNENVVDLGFVKYKSTLIRATSEYTVEIYE